MILQIQPYTKNESRKRKSIFSVLKNVPNSDLIVSADFQFFCQVCGTHVLDRSKHCGVCNRCVDVFDHHCNWLNNCIGRKNYGLFIALLVLVGLFCLLQAIADIILLSTLHVAEYRNVLIDFYNSDEDRVMVFGYVIVSICLAFQTMFIIFIIQLLLLHHWLCKYDLTTYDYVMYLREKELHPDKEIDIMSMKGGHKSKIIRKVTKDSNASDKRKDDNSTVMGLKRDELGLPIENSSRSILDKLYSLSIRTIKTSLHRKDCFRCGAENKALSDPKSSQNPSPRVEPIQEDVRPKGMIIDPKVAFHLSANELIYHNSY